MQKTSRLSLSIRVDRQVHTEPIAKRDPAWHRVPNTLKQTLVWYKLQPRNAVYPSCRGDATCIICREEMTAAKKLACGHLFHIHCLRSWLERQQTCPTCRAPVLPTGSAQPAPNPAGACSLFKKLFVAFWLVVSVSLSFVCFRSSMFTQHCHSTLLT